MKFKRSYLIIVAIVLVIGILWVRGFWFTEVFHSQKSNEPNKKALLQIRDAIGVGASHTEVLTAYWQHRTDALKLFADRPADWIITMPLGWGAREGAFHQVSAWRGPAGRGRKVERPTTERWTEGEQRKMD